VRALDHFQALGTSVARIMTDNGFAYRSYLIADLCRSRRMRRILTRPYTPRTNGKAERSSRPRCANRLTHGPTIIPDNAPTLRCVGFIPTTTDLIAASAAALLSLAFPGTTCCNSTVRFLERHERSETIFRPNEIPIGQLFSFDEGKGDELLSLISADILC
jgi:hypothetical protein